MLVDQDGFVPVVNVYTCPDAVNVGDDRVTPPDVYPVPEASVATARTSETNCAESCVDPTVYADSNITLNVSEVKSIFFVPIDRASFV